MSERRERAAKKRGHGEGSIFQRTDGRWSAILTVGYSTEGKRLRKTIYGKTKREVTYELVKLQSQRLSGTLVSRERMTVAELIDRWLKSWSGQMSPSTRFRYLSMAKHYIKPALGGMDVAKLRPVHIRSLIDKLADDGKGDRTRQYVFATLRRPLNLAVRMELIPRNPCDAVEAPRCKAKLVVPPTTEQVQALLKAAVGSPWESVFVLAVTTGLRQGELFALAWEDVDFERRTISVSHSLEELNGFLRIKEPKSASGRRVVKLSQSAIDSLNNHRRLLMVAGKAGSSWLFTDADGGFVRKSNFARRVWEPIKAAAKLPEATSFHDLRHAHASALLRQNIHPKIVQERLGHSSIKLTMDTYSHLLPDAQDGAADAIDRAWKTPQNHSNGCQMAVKSGDSAEPGAEAVA